ncbi:hypothetical protein ACHAW5_002997 [Stephanodiscus triporus]|uniref:NADH:ubiquinone oxidoreductase intermediate-associated protein 30 domain-containing protein n=1 Tax=Stephanodiscus triporus TaxID=2934178 RepID=A0ABD3NDQ1_9STRA
MQHASSSVEDSYRRGMTAQAYKPHSPVKTNVCQVHPENSGGWKVANWPLWRGTYDEVPLVVIGNVYSCGASPIARNTTTMEVWQPRPDGTFSSLRSGIEEGECRASVPIVSGMDGEFSNVIGNFQYETLAPGSPGIFGGLVPGSDDYPPYGPGGIHMYLNIEGYHPLLGRLDMNDLDDWVLKKDSRGRFRFRGWDLRPQFAKNTNNVEAGGGIEIRSLTKVPRLGYDLALEVKVDVFLVEMEGGVSNSLILQRALIDLLPVTARLFLTVTKWKNSMNDK